MARKPMVRHAHHERLGFPVVLNQLKDPVHSKTVAEVEFEGALYHVIVREITGAISFVPKATAWPTVIGS